MQGSRPRLAAVQVHLPSSHQPPVTPHSWAPLDELPSTLAPLLPCHGGGQGGGGHQGGGGPALAAHPEGAGDRLHVPLVPLPGRGRGGAQDQGLPLLTTIGLS